MCGIVGFHGPERVVGDMIIGLTALQHRGQDAAGIATFDGDAFHLHKGQGLVNDVFKPKHTKKLTGNTGIGHVRYTTQGANDSDLAQPLPDIPFIRRRFYCRAR